VTVTVNQVAPTIQFSASPTAVGATSSLCDPNGITMNGAGDIVVANAVGNSLAYYTASQIISSGALKPQTFIVGAATLLNAPTGLVFGPLSLQ
jgi:hypothetical protein